MPAPEAAPTPDRPASVSDPLAVRVERLEDLVAALRDEVAALREKLDTTTAPPADS
jgi:hypothetical protein